MSRRRRSAYCGLALGAAGLLLGVSGCRKPAQPAQVAPPRAATTMTDTPIAAATTLLNLLREHLQAIASGDKAAADAARAQAAWHVAARDEIFDRYRSSPLAGSLKPALLMDTRVDNWAAMIAYYANGLALDRAQTLTHSDANAVVLVPARGAHDDATLRIECVTEREGQWRVLSLEFEVRPKGASRPATRPATSEPTTVPADR